MKSVHLSALPDATLFDILDRLHEEYSIRFDQSVAEQIQEIEKEISRRDEKLQPTQPRAAQPKPDKVSKPDKTEPNEPSLFRSPLATIVIVITWLIMLAKYTWPVFAGTIAFYLFFRFRQ